MAAKMTCPNCNTVLKEIGDNSKVAAGEYRVYDSLATTDDAEGLHRAIECCECGAINKIEDWE